MVAGPICYSVSLSPAANKWTAGVNIDLIIGEGRLGRGKTVPPRAMQYAGALPVDLEIVCASVAIKCPRC